MNKLATPGNGLNSSDNSRKESDLLIRVEQPNNKEGEQQKIITAISDAISNDYNIRRVEVVGPKVSSELIKKGIIAWKIKLIR